MSIRRKIGDLVLLEDDDEREYLARSFPPPAPQRVAPSCSPVSQVL
jgi:hypothetical protein